MSFVMDYYYLERHCCSFTSGDLLGSITAIFSPLNTSFKLVEIMKGWRSLEMLSGHKKSDKTGGFYQATWR